MNRDPFETLRDRNPVPPGSLPEAPMGTASRIAARRPSVGRGLVISLSAAALVLAAGGSWLLWSRGGASETAVEVTTTVSTETTVVSTPVTASTVTVYFLDADTGALVPVARDLTVLDVRPLPPLGPLTIELLLWGPGAWDAAPLPDPVGDAEAQMTSMIPDQTRLLGFVVDAGTATIDLSSGFVDAPTPAIAQIVFTATSLPDVGRVRFQIEGAPQALDAATLQLVPLDDPAQEVANLPITRAAFEDSLPPVAIETPAAGGSLAPDGRIIGLVSPNAGEVLLELVTDDGAVRWSATIPDCSACSVDQVTVDTAPCPDCVVGEFVVVLPGADTGSGWMTLRASAPASAPEWVAGYPVWVGSAPIDSDAAEPAPTPVGTAAPWSAEPLAAEAVPAVVAQTWLAADNHTDCPVLFPADPAALAAGAVLHDRYFGGGWGLAWDLPSGPGRWEPGGEYCNDCGREAFGVAGAGLPATGQEAIWANRLSWSDGSGGGYGYEGVTAGEAGEPLLAYIRVTGADCLYNVWSYLGEDHLLALIGSLRFVASAP